MKRFLVRFVVWLAIGLAMAFVADAMITSGLRRVDTRKYAVWNDIYKGDIDADLVVIGNSQAWQGYNTYILDTMLGVHSYNLSVDGHSLRMQLLRYKTYRRFNSKPRVIVANVCFFGTFTIMADEQYEREQFFPYINDDTLIDAVAEQKHINWFERHLPLYRYFGYRDDVELGIASFCGKGDFGDGGMHKGYRGENIAWKGGTLPAKGMAFDSVDMELANMLDEFAMEANNEGIELILVKFPECYPMVERLRNLQESDSIFEAVACKYGLSMLNYYYSDITKDSTNYHNYNHLNKKGSIVFTKQLCKDLDSLRASRMVCKDY